MYITMYYIKTCTKIEKEIVLAKTTSIKSACTHDKHDYIHTLQPRRIKGKIVEKDKNNTVVIMGGGLHGNIKNT